MTNNIVNKTDLINRTAEKAGLSKKDVSKTADAILEVIQEALANGEKVQLIGFGTFETSERAARKGRSPQTGKEIFIPATTVPKFKAGKSLKDAVK